MPQRYNLSLSWPWPVRFSWLFISDDSCEKILKEFKGAFGYLYYPYNTSIQLMNLIQGQWTVSDYTIELQTLATEVNWSEVELSEQIKDELVTTDDTDNLNSLISLCNSIDNFLCSHKREKTSTTNQSSQASPASSWFLLPLPNHPLHLQRNRCSWIEYGCLPKKGRGGSWLSALTMELKDILLVPTPSTQRTWLISSKRGSDTPDYTLLRPNLVSKFMPPPPLSARTEFLEQVGLKMEGRTRKMLWLWIFDCMLG